MACAAGKYKQATGIDACDDCEAGKYSTATAAVDQSTCQACPSYTYSGVGSGLLTNCTCNKGYTGSDGVECAACNAGSFKDTNGSDACTLCSAGKYSAAGASVCSDCIAGYDSTGLFAFNVSCRACAPGKYKPTNGSSTCIFCAAKFFQDKSASTVCSICPSSPGVGILSSGVGSTSVANCTLDTTRIHSRATAACNTSVFEQNIHKYRTGIAEVSGADIADVEIFSYTERDSSQVSRRLLTGVVSVDFNFRITVARYFSTSAIANIQGLQYWVAAQGLPGVVVVETLFPTCGAGAEPDPISNVSCRACEYGRMLFCELLEVGFCHRFSCYCI